MRSITFVMIYLAIGLVTTMVNGLGILPNANYAGNSTLNSTALAQFTQQPAVSDANTAGGYWGYFQTSIIVITGIISLIMGAFTGFPYLLGLFGLPIVIITAIVGLIWGWFTFDLLMLWRGVPP